MNNKKKGAFQSSGKSQLGFGNDDLPRVGDGEKTPFDYKNYNVMEEEFEPSGLKVREALDIIRKA